MLKETEEDRNQEPGVMSDCTVLGLCTDHLTAGSLTHSTIVSITGSDCNSCPVLASAPLTGGPLGPTSVGTGTLLATVIPPTYTTHISFSLLDLSAGTYGTWTVTSGGTPIATGLFVSGDTTTPPPVRVTYGVPIVLTATTLGGGTASMLVTWTLS